MPLYTSELATDFDAVLGDARRRVVQNGLCIASTGFHSTTVLVCFVGHTGLPSYRKSHPASHPLESGDCDAMQLFHARASLYPALSYPHPISMRLVYTEGSGGMSEYVLETLEPSFHAG
jgi:hypothetical protein